MKKRDCWRTHRPQRGNVHESCASGKQGIPIHAVAATREKENETTETGKTNKFAIKLRFCCGLPCFGVFSRSCVAAAAEIGISCGVAHNLCTNRNRGGSLGSPIGSVAGGCFAACGASRKGRCFSLFRHPCVFPLFRPPPKGAKGDGPRPFLDREGRAALPSKETGAQRGDDAAENRRGWRTKRASC